jgi:hypothetical protein
MHACFSYFQGFAVASQKLLLNIRHEMKHREESPRSLGIALSLFGTFYVAICLLAGKSRWNLNDAIYISCVSLTPIPRNSHFNRSTVLLIRCHPKRDESSCSRIVTLDSCGRLLCHQLSSDLFVHGSNVCTPMDHALGPATSPPTTLANPDSTHGSLLLCCGKRCTVLQRLGGSDWCSHVRPSHIHPTRNITSSCEGTSVVETDSRFLRFVRTIGIWTRLSSDGSGWIDRFHRTGLVQTRSSILLPLIQDT